MGPPELNLSAYASDDPADNLDDDSDDLPPLPPTEGSSSVTGTDDYSIPALES
jgi:hypothetical protein